MLRPAPRRGSGTPGADRADGRVPGLTLRASARMAVFWVLVVAFFVANFATNSVTIHLIPYLSDRGYSPTLAAVMIGWIGAMQLPARLVFAPRSEEHTSELQSLAYLVCRLLLEKKKKI